MSGFDANRVYSVTVHDAPEPQGIEQPSEIERMLFEFLLQYRIGGEFIYRSVCRKKPWSTPDGLIETNFVQICS